MSLDRARELAEPLIKAFEGLHKRVGNMIHAYVCPAGYPTQGWGIVVPSLDVPPITPEQADAKFSAVLPAYMMDALKLSPVLAAHPARLAAVTSFVFNLGAARYKSSTLRRRINAGEWMDAAEEFDKWVLAAGKKMPGLVKRRAAERELFEAA